MDKVLSSLLCCTIGSKQEQTSSTCTTTSSSRNTSETNNRSDSKNADKQDDVEEVNIDKTKIDNSQTIILQPMGNKSEMTNQNNTNNSTPVTPTLENKNKDDNSVNSDNNSSTDISNDDKQNINDYNDQNNNDYINYFDLTTMQPDQSVSKSGWLLEEQNSVFKNKKCLVLDLDETLVHSSFKYLRSADFVIPVEIEGQVHNVYVIKRPGVDEFMKRVGELYEVVVFTASVSRYGDPLLDELDVHKSVHHRLFRDSCYNYQGNYIKNLSQIGRPLKDLIIIDNSPASYIFHPQHAVPISSWFSDAHDNELLDLLPFLEDLSKPTVDDIGLVLDVTTS